MSLNTDRPFVLIDDARPGGTARLYRAPREVVTCADPAGVAAALAQVRAHHAGGAHVAGFLSYPDGGTAEGGDVPPLWFGLFDGAEDIADVAALLPEPAGAWAGAPQPAIDRARYGAAFDAVAGYIRAGDIYQANLTFRASVAVAGSPLALYAAIRPRAQAGYGALVWTGQDWILSFSPELFFAVEGTRITARPMKGTAPRGRTAAEDARLADMLAADPKQRAENLMILDLMRNDLSRVSRPGSVGVPERFVVERYPTVHQMVSTVTATLAPPHDVFDALAALFPCGSVTGAPKKRAMEVIAAVETGARGTYTGAIGAIDPGGDASFSVAIRTLHLKPGEAHATIGLGSGVVADSDVEGEWQECLAKGSFVATRDRRFDLIETMLFDPHDGIVLLDRHLERMKASAQTFGFAFDRHAARNELQAATFSLLVPSRVRLLAGRSGAMAIEVSAMPSPHADGPIEVAIVPLPVDSGDFRLRHKTTDRGFYDDARARAGTAEVAFVDRDGFLTEGSFTSLFVERDGVLATPPLARGLLPGVLRAELIDSGRAVEHDLRVRDLAGGFLIGNALRGVMPAVAVAK